jgi:predicted amidohydrolase
LAVQNKISIVGSLLEKRGMEVANSATFFASNGKLLGVYRKIHLFPLMQEDKWLLPGEVPLATDMPWGRTGFAICYDLRFPELFRRYARDRVEVIVMSMAWPHPRLAHYRTLLRARAVENQCYMIAVNRIGADDDGTRYFGHSCVIDPWGDVVEAGDAVLHRHD